MSSRTTSLVVALSALVLLTAPTGATAQGPAGVDHYLCYEPRDSSGHGPKEVKLRDQFGTGFGIAAKPFRLCNPVDKNGEGILNREGHLLCYVFDPQELPDAKEHTVLTRNQFGETKLLVDKPDILCVPSYKREIQ